MTLTETQHYLISIAENKLLAAIRQQGFAPQRRNGEWKLYLRDDALASGPFLNLTTLAKQLTEVSQ